MKNKTKTYLLLFAVLSIWGTVAYKILNGLNPEQPQTTMQDFDMAFNPKEQTAIDTFSITTVKRDPFLGTLSTKAQTPKQTKNVKTVTSNVVMPIITYGGLIQKQNSKTKVFVVNINNKQFLLKQGETVNDVKLVSGNKKSIVIRFNGKNQTINI
ncbi:hypothetical protein [Winogradskyella luteola]|uniref:Type II secretion system protein GspC N-terminal domain-containing protein n=1 Tax=Winogradskyella luteola TaxID=2828330 RepID=A0A9X1F824_9FLAO|nr:hypothetical protein [Winogradskyella luteola]MBV7269070.1 hypothetical protein [Winogradskyella luteola]